MSDTTTDKCAACGKEGDSDNKFTMNNCSKIIHRQKSAQYVCYPCQLRINHFNHAAGS